MRLEVYHCGSAQTPHTQVPCPAQAWIKAGGDAGYGSIPDYNGVRQEGCAPMPMTVFHSGARKGERCSAAAAYLEPAARTHGASLRLHTNAHAQSIVWSQDSE